VLSFSPVLLSFPFRQFIFVSLFSRTLCFCLSRTLSSYAARLFLSFQSSKISETLGFCLRIPPLCYFFPFFLSFFLALSLFRSLALAILVHARAARTIFSSLLFPSFSSSPLPLLESHAHTTPGNIIHPHGFKLFVYSWSSTS